MHTGIRLIQYADSGCGKSVRASEASRWGRVEYHDFDEQASSLTQYLKAVDPGRLENITFVSYVGKDKAKKAEAFIARINELVKLRESGKPVDIATIVIDSYSSFESLLGEVIFSKFSPSSSAFGQARTTINVGNDEVILPGSMDYSVLSTYMKRIFEGLKATGLNIILNAHAKDFLEQRGRVVKLGTVQAAGQIRDVMPSFFHEWHYLFIDANAKHRVQVKPTAHWLAKTSCVNVPANGVLLDASLKMFDDVAYKISPATEKKAE